MGHLHTDRQREKGDRRGRRRGRRRGKGRLMRKIKPRESRDGK